MSKSHSMKLTLKLALLLYTLASIGGCIKIPQPCAKDYAFDFPVTVTPKDTFIVGDTIWWEMNIPNQLLDRASGAYIDLTDFELFFDFIISKVDSTEPITGSGQTHLFVPVEDKGKIIQNQGIFAETYFTTVSTQDKQFRLGYVPTQSGTYFSEVNFPSLYSRKDSDLDDELQIVDPNCEETLTFLSKIIVNNRDMNYHMVDGVCKYT